jgi:V/A-type H+/Na+-transporting ATPase subunit K
MTLRKSAVLVLMAVMTLCLVGVGIAFAKEAASTVAGVAENQSVPAPVGGGSGVAFAVALVVGLGCVGGGYAVGRVGSSALGALSERPELFGRALVFVGLAEGIAIYGLIIGIMLMRG